MFQRRFAIAAFFAALVVAGAAAAGYSYYQHRTGNVDHPDARFVPQTLTSPSPPPPVQHNALGMTWGIYGFTENHARFFAGTSALHPPFTQVWVRRGTALLEFPPVIMGNRLFQLGDNGSLIAVNTQTGHSFWSRQLGSLSASSPAVGGQSVYATVMSRRPGVDAGRVVALNFYSGSMRWSRNLPSPSESSPLLDRGHLYFGSQSGTVYALDAANGRLLWTYHAPGPVKASLTLDDGVLYFGDYSGHVQAVSERTGRRIWISGSGGRLFGSGQFYSTAAAVYGRVFLGNTDGRVYAYDQRTGALDWAHQTGAYVYASPAVANAPGLGPTIYIGSYDGTFYALNARTGAVRWTFHAGGRISGSATIIGRIVYFADLGARRTFGLGISTGRRLFSWETGSFDPVISDGSRIYLTGYTGLFGLQPRPIHPATTAAPHKIAPRPTRTPAPHRQTTHKPAAHQSRAHTRPQSHRPAQHRTPAHHRPAHRALHPTTHRQPTHHTTRRRTAAAAHHAPAKLQHSARKHPAHAKPKPHAKPKRAVKPNPKPAPAKPKPNPFAFSATCREGLLAVIATGQPQGCAGP